MQYQVIPNIVLPGLTDLTIYSGLIKLKSDKCMHILWNMYICLKLILTMENDIIHLYLHGNITLGIGQKVMLLHSVMRLFSACVKKDKMADLLSDAWCLKIRSKLELQATFKTYTEQKESFFHVCHKQNHYANT